MRDGTKGSTQWRHYLTTSPIAVIMLSYNANLLLRWQLVRTPSALHCVISFYYNLDRNYFVGSRRHTIQNL